LAAKKGELDVLQEIWDWDINILTEEIKNCYYSKTVKEISWHMATGEGELNALQKFWDWAKYFSNRGVKKYVVIFLRILRKYGLALGSIKRHTRRIAENMGNS
jgi:hypothetical protein